MKKIELTKDEIIVLERTFKGQFTATAYEVEHFGNVIDKATPYSLEYEKEHPGVMINHPVVLLWRSYLKQQGEKVDPLEKYEIAEVGEDNWVREGYDKLLD